MSSQDRLKQLELLGGVGGAILGGGVALLFGEWLRPFAVPAVVVGAAAHGWAMFQRRRIEISLNGGWPAWEVAAYWACWALLAALALYVTLRLT